MRSLNEERVPTSIDPSMDGVQFPWFKPERGLMAAVLELAFLDARSNNAAQRRDAINWMSFHCEEDEVDTYTFRGLVTTLGLDITAVDKEVKKLYDEHKKRSREDKAESSTADCD